MHYCNTIMLPDDIGVIDEPDGLVLVENIINNGIKIMHKYNKKIKIEK